MSSTHDEDLLSDLQDVLSADRSSRVATLPLGVLLEDVRALLLHRRDKSWRKARGAVQTDWDATVSRLGADLRIVLGPALDRADQQVQDLMSGAAHAAARRAAEPSLAALHAALRTEASIRAAWRDLLNSLGPNEDDTGAVARCRAAVADALESAGHDVDGLFKLAQQVLDDSAYAVAEANVRLGRAVMPANIGALVQADAGMGRDERMALVADLLSTGPQTGRCVVWLGFRNARIDACFFEGGPVTFFDAQWAVPNAQDKDGQAFPFRDELSRAPQLPDPDEVRNVVLARVDLGVRAVAGAVPAAVDIAEALVQAALSSRSVGTWSTYGWRQTFVDGHLAGSQHFTPEDELRAWTPPYKLDAVAERLTDLGPRLGRALATAAVAGELREALKSATDAHSADATGRLLHHYRVLELIAAVAGLEADSLAAQVAAHWPMNLWRSRCMDAVVKGRDAWTRSPVPVPAAVSEAVHHGPGLRFVVDFKAASAEPELLTRHIPTPVSRRECRALVASLRDPVAARVFLERFSVDGRVLLTRLGRVRNALVHGNPIHPRVVQGLDEFAEFLARSVLLEALEAHMDGTDLRVHLGRGKESLREFERGLRAGSTPVDLWESRRRS